MQTLEELKKAAKTKLVGYTDREIECFVQGATYMAGQLPQRKSEEWYRQQAERKAKNIERSDAVRELFKDVSGLGTAVDNLKNRDKYEESTNHILEVIFKNILCNPDYRKQMLELLQAEDLSVSSEMYDAIKIGIQGFNKNHTDIQLDFARNEDNDGRWTFSWDELIKPENLNE